MNVPVRTVASLSAALLIAILWPVVSLLAQPVTPTATTAPPPYVAPAASAVLSGTAPLRILIVSKQAMLAWKGDDEIKVINPADGTSLYTAPTGEQVGLVRVPEDASMSLRKASTNFCPLTGAVRLESAKPIQLWASNSNSWTTSAAPLIVTPVADGSFSVAREMSLEEYVRNVVPAEMPATFHPQALRAQAIIARTYALIELGRHADEGSDLCAQVHCQAFSPETKRAKATDDAVSETKGLVLYYGNKLAEPYYHACCGGGTDDASYVWGPEYARPYLTGSVDLPGKHADDKVEIKDLLAQKDPYCKRASNVRWTRHFFPAEVNALVARNLAKVTGNAAVKITTVSNMTVEERTPGGRAASLRIEGDNASVLVVGDQIRWLFGTGVPGPDGLWSTLFDLTLTRDETDKITGYTFTGAGRGHGLGLCQWGADGRAKAGQSFREIIRAYYPGTRLSDEKG
ncbi:MAG TPA: SpoIID/LytB domain-containing protein [Armatimonadota bacterium]|jgi:SpoIID/LytB domain protein